MSNVINRATLELRVSVNTPDFPVGEWIVNPDLSAVTAVPKRYWKVRGDAVVEMTAPEKAAVDASETARDKTEFLVARSRNGTLYRIAISDAGALLPPVAIP